MLKIPKGLKKKKKGKKSKRKGEDELFTEEELKKYKEAHQAQDEQSSTKNEEWSKFTALTSGVDTVLKKTQGDLDRIKSTSFFQRVPSGVKTVDSTGKEVAQPDDKWVEFQAEEERKRIVVDEAPAEASSTERVPESAEVSESEYEDDDADDIFDTSFVEAVEKGEVKLAYVPDSPDELLDDGPDPFDTSYAEKVIKLPETGKKGKRTIDIGVAVEVLTGHLDNLSTSIVKRPKRRTPCDLLLESADDVTDDFAAPAVTTEKSLLDDAPEIDSDLPVDLSVSLHTQLAGAQKTTEEIKEKDITKDILADFDVITNKDSDDDEFAQLAVESLSNQNEPKKVLSNVDIRPVEDKSWSAFENGIKSELSSPALSDIDGPDPFDTTFVDGKFGQTENDEDSDTFDFDPRKDELPSRINNRRISSVHIHLTNPAGEEERFSEDEGELNPLNHHKRDLLGGSNTDLTQLQDSPISPLDLSDTLEESDPFDTSTVDQLVAPGKIELKLLEEELVGSVQERVQTVISSDSDSDFDPRAEEKIEEPIVTQRKPSRPENLFINKSVAFKVDEEESNDLLNTIKIKSGKPLTPFYNREASIAEDDDQDSANFTVRLSHSASDQDLQNTLNQDQVLQKRRHSEFSVGLIEPSINLNQFRKDLLVVEEDEAITTKVLTPGILEEEETDDIDPFDTSVVGNILPSKTELKLLEEELIPAEEPKKQESDFLDPTDDFFQVKALTPVIPKTLSVDEDSFDPFDTSIACNIAPGKSELKLLESEFLK